MSCLPRGIGSYGTAPFGAYSFGESELMMREAAKTDLYKLLSQVQAALIPLSLALNVPLLCIKRNWEEDKATGDRSVQTIKLKVVKLLSSYILAGNVCYGVGGLIDNFPVILFLDKETAVSYVNSFFFSLGFFTSQLYTQILPFSLLLLALYYFTVILTPHWKLFEGRLFHVLLSFVWLLIFLISLCLTMFECAYVYSEDDYQFQHVCNKLLSLETSKILSTALLIQEFVFPVATLLLLAVSMFQLHNKRKPKHELTTVRLVFGVLIFAIFELSFLTGFSVFNRKVNQVQAFVLKRVVSIGELLAVCLTAGVIGYPGLQYWRKKDRKEEEKGETVVVKKVKPDSASF